MKSVKHCLQLFCALVLYAVISSQSPAVTVLDLPNGTDSSAPITLTDDLNIQQNDTGGSATISGQISESSGSFGLIKSGAGSITLSNANTFTGDSFLNQGQLVLENKDALGTGTLNINGGSLGVNIGAVDLVLSNNTVWNNDWTFNAFSTGDLQLTGNVALGNDVAVTTNDSSPLVLDGSISDSGGARHLTFLSNKYAYPGNFRVTGTNTYSGGTTLSNTKVVINNGSAFGTGDITLQDNSYIVGAVPNITLVNDFNLEGRSTFREADFTLNGNVTLTDDATISTDEYPISGVVRLNGNIGETGGPRTLRYDEGTFYINGNNTYTGGTILDSGTIFVGSNTAFGAGEIRAEGMALSSDLGAYIISNDIELYSNYGTMFIGSNDIELSGKLMNGSIIIDTTAKVYLTGSGSKFHGVGVEQGELVVNSDIEISGPIYTEAPGRLSGNGTIRGTRFGAVVNYGTIAPGNSIGTLTLGGIFQNNFSYSQSYRPGIVEIEINDSGNTPGVNNDLIKVVDSYTSFEASYEIDGNGNIIGIVYHPVESKAVITGGSVNVLAEAGTYNAGTKYTFLTADEIVGEFDFITDDLASLDAYLSYTDTSISFTLVDSATAFQSLSANDNQSKIGTAIDFNTSGAGGDFLTVLNTLKALPINQVQNSLAQMSGEVHGTSGQLGVQNTSLATFAISGQLRSSIFSNQNNSAGSNSRGNYETPSGFTSMASVSDVAPASFEETVFRQQSGCDYDCGWTSWVLGYGLGGHARSDGNASGLNYYMGGNAIGLERELDDSHRIGFFGSYIASQVRTEGINQRNQIDGSQLGVFFTGTNGSDYYIVMGGAQLDYYDSARVVQMGNINRVARANYDGWQSFAYTERGWTFNPNYCTTFQPFAAMQYVHLRQNGFTETGANALNLQVSGSDTNSLRSLIGARWQIQMRTDRTGRSFSPEVRALWMHEFLDTTSLVNAQFATVGGAGFATTGLDLGRDWAVVGAGLSRNLYGGWQVRADYNVQANGQQIFHVGSCSASHSW